MKMIFVKPTHSINQCVFSEEPAKSNSPVPCSVQEWYKLI